MRRLPECFLREKEKDETQKTLCEQCGARGVKRDCHYFKYSLALFLFCFCSALRLPISLTQWAKTHALNQPN
jgi:hypothetical protein